MFDVLSFSFNVELIHLKKMVVINIKSNLSFAKKR